MTKQEFIKMAGNEDQAEYAMMILLKNIKPEFMRMCMDLELKEVEIKIKKYEELGYIYYCNQHYSVNWCKPDEPFKDREVGWKWNITDEERYQIEKCEDMCRDAERLLQKRNRINTWL